MPSDNGRPNYDENAFYLESTDSKGHSAWARFRVQPWVSGFVGEIVARPDTAYRTKDDFYRDAVAHRALWVGDNLPVGPQVREAIATFRVESALTTLLEMQKSHETAKKKLEDFLRNANDAERRSIQSTLDQLTLGLPETYRAQLRAIQGRWT